MTKQVTVGTVGGLRYACITEDVFTMRIVAYAMGGYQCSYHTGDGNWLLFAKGAEIPLEVERALCDSLGIPCARTA